MQMMRSSRLHSSFVVCVLLVDLISPLVPQPSCVLEISLQQQRPNFVSSPPSLLQTLEYAWQYSSTLGRSTLQLKQRGNIRTVQLTTSWPSTQLRGVRSRRPDAPLGRKTA